MYHKRFHQRIATLESRWGTGTLAGCLILCGLESLPLASPLVSQRVELAIRWPDRPMIRFLIPLFSAPALLSATAQIPSSAQSPPADTPASCAPSTRSNRICSGHVHVPENCGSPSPVQCPLAARSREPLPALLQHPETRSEHVSQQTPNPPRSRQKGTARPARSSAHMKAAPSSREVHRQVGLDKSRSRNVLQEVE